MLGDTCSVATFLIEEPIEKHGHNKIHMKQSEKWGQITTLKAYRFSQHHF